MTRKLSATLLTAAALAAIPTAITPVAQADVCGDVGGRHVSVGGCTDVARDLAVPAIAGAAVVGNADMKIAKRGRNPAPVIEIVPVAVARSKVVLMTL